MNDTEKLNQALEDLECVYLCLERTFARDDEVSLCDLCMGLDGDFANRPVLETCAKAHISAAENNVANDDTNDN